MRNEHRDIQKWILRRYARKYRIAAEIDGQNRLPDQERHWYQPDVILRSKRGVIEYIIEVENDPMRKALVGASVLADASISALKQRKKPTLIFVVYTTEGIRQIPNFNSKVEIVKPYCRCIAEILVVSLADFQRMKL